MNIKMNDFVGNILKNIF